MRDYKIYFLVIDDISKAVPGLKLKRSYGKWFHIRMQNFFATFPPFFNFCFLDFAIPSHMLEIYDFPKSVRTADLMNVSLSTRLR